MKSLMGEINAYIDLKLKEFMKLVDKKISKGGGETGSGLFGPLNL
jgi:hypothetical protein